MAPFCPRYIPSSGLPTLPRWFPADTLDDVNMRQLSMTSQRDDPKPASTRDSLDEAGSQQV